MHASAAVFGLFSAWIGDKYYSMSLHKSIYLIAFLLFIVASFVVYPVTGTPSLVEIYKSGKIELIPELVVNRDSFPENVNVKFLTSFSVGKGNLYISDSS